VHCGEAKHICLPSTVDALVALMCHLQQGNAV
jgi:hypothetical protein